MCGITGILSFKPGIDHSQAIRCMTDSLKHRGPDGEGFYHDEHIWLGHRRLSIIDLEGGRQPMSNEDSSLWITYNGEIYNYVELMIELKAKGHEFKTRCDTEVILHAYEQWGEQCVHHFNGMWAFALWDKAKQLLMLSRDHFGIKPLFYSKTAEKFYWASEIKSILAAGVKASPNLPALSRFICDGYLNCDQQSLFKDIDQLEPGHNLIIKIDDFQHLNFKSYWPQYPLQNHLTYSHSPKPDQVHDLLTDAVAIRLRSDVPIGSTLSGGIDSSSIVGLAHRITTQQQSPFSYHTFTAHFPDFSLDESQYVRLLAKQNSLQTHFVRMAEDDLPHELEKLVYHQEIPLTSGSCYAQWKVMEAVHENGIKVLLDGQGGDEVFIGYPMFFPAAIADFIAAGNWRQAWLTARSAINYHSFLPHQLLGYTLFNFIPIRLRSKLRHFRKSITLPLHPDLKAVLPPKKFPVIKCSLNRLSYHQLMVIKHWQLPDLLHFEDRNSMAFSLETRLPFLDQRLVEMGMVLANHDKIRDGYGKWLLRQAVKGIVPDDILKRYDKIGFAAPDQSWLEGKLGVYFKKIICSESFNQRNWIDHQWLYRFKNGEINLGTNMMWKLASLEIWARVFLDQSTPIS